MSSGTDKASPAQVRRRRVMYIPGYDPFHARRYRELYRKEAAAQAAVSGYEITLSPKTTEGPYGWHVRSVIEGQTVDTDVEVLVWSDIVKQSMGTSIPATYREMLRTAWVYIGSGALFRVVRLRKGPAIAALYPVILLMLQAVLAIAFGAWLGGWAADIVDWAVRQGGFGPSLSWLGGGIGVLLGAAIAWSVLVWFRRWDSKFLVYYLVHNFCYSAQHRGANPPELEARMADFAARIREALHDDVDEVLVVGHSSGVHLGVSILADLLRAGELPEGGPTLGFLSLGHVVPMVSFLPEAKRLRRDLHDLSQSDRLTWIDVTAPGDGCAFALCDPVSVSGVAPTQGKRWPLVFSAAFTQSLSPERWKALRWRFFRLHFQYLCAFDAPKDYDYFKITAGPLTLAERYKGRPPSKSRIEAPVNGFPSMA